MKFVLAAWIFLAGVIFTPAAENAATAPKESISQGAEHAPEEHAGEHGGIPPAAERIHSAIPITNSMIVSWIVALGLIVFAQIAMRNVREVPEGAQNFWEWMVEGLHDFLDGVMGHEWAHKTFWFFATIFIFILAANWFGLLPGVGTIIVNGKPLFRGANADLNMTLAMAMVFFACWTIWALQANGPGGFLMHLFGPKGETTGALKVLMIFVFLLVGVLEVVSILFRPVSLSFRLYGNVFAGENMLEHMAQQSNFLLKVLIPIPFYFLEVLVGLVQALVFMLLTAVFTLLIVTHEEGHEKGHAH